MTLSKNSAGRHEDGEPVQLTSQESPEDQQEIKTWHSVNEAIEAMKSSPLKLNRRSGVGEEIYVGLNIRPTSEARNEKVVSMLEEEFSAKFKEMVTVYAYVEGNGVLHQAGELKLVGHRDLILFEDSDNLIVYTDYRTNDYYPSEKQKSDDPTREYSSYFNGSNYTIERYHFGLEEKELKLQALRQEGRHGEVDLIEKMVEEGQDIYGVGLGNIMQAVAMFHLNSLPARNMDIQLGIDITPAAIGMWEKFGVEIDYPERKGRKKFPEEAYLELVKENISDAFGIQPNVD